MKSGPLRTMIAFFGLIALTPLAWMLVKGTIDPMDAGIKAGIILCVVLVVSRLIDVALSAIAASLERQVLGSSRRAMVDAEEAATGGR